MAGLNILYVEDDARAARQVRDLAAKGGDVVQWADNGTDGLKRAGAEPFDVIILDRMLPDLDGLTILARLRESGIDTPVLMLSALGRTSDRAEGLDGGADDYLAKPFESEELLARLRALHRRASGRAHSAVILYGAFECHVKARTAFRANRHLSLSPREFELFRYFMENAGEVLTREMLLRDVWKMNFDPQTNVVDVNIGRLRRKLEEGFDSPALETIWGAGYRLLEGR
ncbi:MULTISPECIES: response regulator transcription factor [Novosphingobium]|uniref:Response regulator transcription factor n=2 Tax=Novosphingobium TaxID=165696 RepID=A0ABT0ADM2_9SPHN|nr:MULTISPECIES: response regulator transcription factor [Novosphingobium]MCJ1961292.1 response regulator transcription factor [Novosphingobium mangrovi (ex Hu et al. 2023)]MED5543687.1 response regulator transcription factor [Pseudomonadota bacterium]QVM84897.1 response regulator transcription factor [Novosphingobium decolorationis]GAM03985.1 OmpR family two-component system response regulator [Novosphingobium sp. MBES04]